MFEGKLFGGFSLVAQESLQRSRHTSGRYFILIMIPSCAGPLEFRILRSSLNKFPAEFFSCAFLLACFLLT